MKTVVEWLVDQLNLHEYEDVIKQAKEMEKEQIMQAFANGKINGDKNWTHRYYNKTFKSE